MLPLLNTSQQAFASQTQLLLQLSTGPKDKHGGDAQFFRTTFTIAPSSPLPDWSAFALVMLFHARHAHTVQFSRWRYAPGWFANQPIDKKKKPVINIRCSSEHLYTGVEHIHAQWSPLYYHTCCFLKILETLAIWLDYQLQHLLCTVMFWLVKYYSRTLPRITTVVPDTLTWAPTWLLQHLIRTVSISIQEP